MGQIVGQPEPRAPINGQPPKFPVVDPRDLIEAATPLPWRTRIEEYGEEFWYSKGYIAVGPAVLGRDEDEADAALIVYAVNHLPALLDVAEALERLLANPYGCRFCDAGVLRKFRPHDDNCEWEQAREALARLKESR